MTAAFSCILFDLDGTLIDTAPGITETVAYTLETLDWPAEDPATLLAHCGPPLTTGFVEVSGMPPVLAARAAEIYRERYLAIGSERSEPFPGIAGLLTALRRTGTALAVATSKSEDTAAALLQRFGIAEPFSAITGSDAAAGRSSKAEVVREALRRLDGRQEDTSKPVLLGDRKYDVEGAAALGVPTIGALWGYAAGREELAGAIALAVTPAAAGRLLGL